MAWFLYPKRELSSQARIYEHPVHADVGPKGFHKKAWLWSSSFSLVFI